VPLHYPSAAENNAENKDTHHFSPITFHDAIAGGVKCAILDLAGARPWVTAVHVATFELGPFR
jgi:hypothetical protein